MPRTLPWKRNESGIRAKKETAPRKRVKIEAELDRDTTPTNPTRSPTHRDFLRSSHSPPTSPAKQCPPEEFLIPGIHNDDGWIMVEDEFYAMAQTYTQHLHYAEYLRRRREVKNEKSASLERPERHMDNLTPLPRDIQRRREQEALRGQQTAGVAQVVEGKADEAEGEDDELFAGMHLHNLMTSPRKARSLAGLQALRTSTRAAAGTRQAPASGNKRARINRIESRTSVNKGLETEAVEIDEETASDSDDNFGQEATANILDPRKEAQSVVHCDETPRAHSGSELRTLPTSRLGFRTEPPRRQLRPASTFKSKIQSLFDDLDT